MLIFFWIFLLNFMALRFVASFHGFPTDASFHIGIYALVTSGTTNNMDLDGQARIKTCVDNVLDVGLAWPHFGGS